MARPAQLLSGAIQFAAGHGGGGAHALAPPHHTPRPPSLPRNQRKKKALVETKERCNRLASENALLLRQLEEQQREGYVVAEHFRSEVLAKNAQVAQLQVGACGGFVLQRERALAVHRVS